VEDPDDAPFTCHTFFVFFGGDKCGEAFAGVSLISVSFSPLALLIGFDFLGWWHPLNAFTLISVSFSPFFPAPGQKIFYQSLVPVSIAPPLV
jgi:hypothetical protein